MAVAVLAWAAAIGLLYYGQLFFITLLSSVIITFILEPYVKLVIRLRIPRAVASFAVCSVALLIVYLLGLGLVSQASGLASDLPNYTRRVNDILNGALDQVVNIERGFTQFLPKRKAEAPVLPAPVDTKTKGRKKTPDPPMPPPIQEVRIRDENTPIVSWVVNNFGSIFDVVLMVSFVPFLVYFMLAWSDHLQRTFLRLFSDPRQAFVKRCLEAIAANARAYVAGNFLLGLAVSIASVIFFLLIRLPYPLLVGPMSGFLTLVPYLGLPLALIPPVFAALPVYSNFSAYLLILSVVAFLHLLSLNLLYPKVVGARVHLNPLAVTISLMFWGLLWGGSGLVLAIPVTSGIKAVCDNIPEWEMYGKLLGD